MVSPDPALAHSDLPQLGQGGTIPPNIVPTVKPVVFTQSSGPVPCPEHPPSPPACLFHLSACSRSSGLAPLGSQQSHVSKARSGPPQCVHHNPNFPLLQSSPKLASSCITNRGLRHSCPSLSVSQQPCLFSSGKATALFRGGKLVDCGAP